VGGEIGTGQCPDDQLADVLAIGATAGSRSEPAHHLAHVAGGSRPGSGDRLADQPGDVGLGQRLGEVLGEDRDLGLLLRGQVLATTTPERLDRFAARFTSRLRTASSSSSVSGC
jgi:hypothetical protein